MSTVTRRRRGYQFAVRGPLGPWAVWVRQQRENHRWTEADLVAVLWGEPTESRIREVHRWEAGHWGPGDDARTRLVAAFGSDADGIEAPVSAYAGSIDEWLPIRVTIADAITAARADLGIDAYNGTAGIEADAASGDVVDLADLDVPLPDLTHHDDEDGWDL